MAIGCQQPQRPGCFGRLGWFLSPNFHYLDFAFWVRFGLLCSKIQQVRRNPVFWEKSKKMKKNNKTQKTYKNHENLKKEGKKQFGDARAPKSASEGLGEGPRPEFLGSSSEVPRKFK